jgi:hypothetical protein
MEPISPELALVDPELAARARALLPPVGLDLAPAPAAPAPPPAPRHRSWRDRLVRTAAWLAVPSIALNVALIRTDGTGGPTFAATPGPTMAVTIPLRALQPPPSSKPPKLAGVESAQHIRIAPPRVATRVLRWPASARSKAYDVVVWRGRRRIADVWTSTPKVTIAALACRGSRPLEAGRYLWFVYPLVAANPRRYGPLAKWGRFAVASGTHCRPHRSN